MIGSPQLNEIQKDKIICLREDGYKIWGISQKTNILKYKIGVLSRKYPTSYTLLCPRTNGLKKSLDNKVLKFLDDNVRNNRKLSEPEINAILKEKTNKVISTKTTKNGLKEFRYKAHVIYKKPLLSKKILLKN